MKYLIITYITLIKICVVYSQVVALSLYTPGSVKISEHQEQDDSYQYREDNYAPRNEGIKSSENQNVTVDRIELLSAKAISTDEYTGSIPELIHLGFYSDKVIHPEVHVKYDPKLYFMDPVRNQWGPGLSVFSWPGDILVRNNIPVDELYAQALVTKSGIRTIYPVSVYTIEPPDTIRKYQFTIVTLTDMDVTYQVIDLTTETAIYQSDEITLSAQEPYPFDWLCQDDNGNLLPEGDYLLRFDGHYTYLEDHVKNVSITYRFTHKPIY